jgi:hypothetical protein
MIPANDDSRARPLALPEWLFLGSVILAWAVFVVLLGKDTSWDFRNYHWYIPYAYLNGRLGFDIAVSHIATYYNPLVDVPYYWLATHTPPWFTLGTMGAVQGANVIPLYLIARQTFTFAENRLAAAAVAALGMTGALTISLAGTTYYDNVMSVATLSSLAILVVYRDTLIAGALKYASAISVIAGVIAGAAVGLKLPEAPFAVGFAAALVALGGEWRQIAVRVAAGGLGGLLGVAIFAGPWMLRMEEFAGNPLFPYFNTHFHSPLAVNDDYRDMRFLQDFAHQIVMPLLFSFDWRIAGDLPSTDIRIGIAYVALIGAALAWALSRILGWKPQERLVDPAAARAILAFAIFTFIAWVKFFCIYRYILALEMLAPIVIAVVVAMLPLAAKPRFVIAGALFFAAVLVSQPSFSERVPLNSPFVEVLAPKITNPEKAMVLLTGQEPIGFLIPSFPKEIPFVRIDGWMYTAEDRTGLTDIVRARVRQHMKEKKHFYLLTDADNMTRAHDALEHYNLAIHWQKCRLFDTNIRGTYQLCPVGPWPAGMPHHKGMKLK